MSRDCAWQRGGGDLRFYMGGGGTTFGTDAQYMILLKPNNTKMSMKSRIFIPVDWEKGEF